MSHEFLPDNALLLTRDKNGNFAMACIYLGLILTPHHVALGKPYVEVRSTGEDANVDFVTPLPDRDISYSDGFAKVPGFETRALPSVGELLTIVGYHGHEHQPFSIEVRVLEIERNGRVRVQRLSGAQAQEGMSGSAVINQKQELIGIFVAGVEGAQRQQLYIESIGNIELPPSPYAHR